MKILFIGNSYTYYNDMPTLFSRLCGCNGKQARVFSVAKGGRRLHENLDSSDETTRQLEAVVAQNKMDVYVLQEHSTLPLLDFQRFSANVTGLMEKLGPARYVLYQTWGRKTGSAFLEEHKFSTRTMALRLQDAYRKVAETAGADRAPVGLCFLQVSENHPEIELYDPDLTHPSYEGSCLAALVHYRTIFDEIPKDLSCFTLPEDTKTVFLQVLSSFFEE